MRTLPEVFWILVVFILVVGGIMRGIFTPTEAGAVGTFAVLLLAIFNRNMTFKIYVKSVKEGLRTAIMILMLVAGSTVLGHFVTVTMALAILARQLGGRTLGLFTSLSRMREVAERLGELLEGEGLEVLVPLRASDDPGGLVERFRKLHGEAVMLGSRRYWQGIDVRGDDLQAVVIEKLPFEVPTELRRRRDLRLRAAGEDPFARAALGHMLLHLKQMIGRLIRSETDRGLGVIVDARADRGYFRRLPDALPDGVRVERAGLEVWRVNFCERAKPQGHGQIGISG